MDLVKHQILKNKYIITNNITNNNPKIANHLDPCFSINSVNKLPNLFDKNAIISHHVSIEGPAYIGTNSFISPGSRIKENTIIGPYCKIGGEVSNCNFLGYSKSPTITISQNDPLPLKVLGIAMEIQFA